MKKVHLIFSILFFTFSVALADITDDIASAIKSGNAKQLASFFNTNVELNLPGNEGVYSKAQSEMILKDFFNKHNPKNFNLMHQGASKDGAKYAIGKLETASGTYRIYLFLKKQADAFLIKEFRIEADK